MSWNQNKEWIITNVTIYDFRSYIDKGFIHFGSHIIKVGDMADYEDYEKDLVELSSCSHLDGEGKLLLPGFVAGHTHMYSAFARGLALPFSPESFQDILDQLWWKLDGALTLEQVKFSGITCAMDFIRSGVTTMIDHHASGSIEGSLGVLSEAVCDIGGLRGGFCFEASDRFDMDKVLKEQHDFAKVCHDHQTQHSQKDRFSLFGLHASMSLSDESLVKMKKLVGDHPIHVHVAESAEDEALCQDIYGKSVIRRLYDHGLLNEDSILVHCVHISESDAKLIKEKDCTVAVNVTSNMNNSVGLPDLSLFRKYEIPVIIGNDGMTCDIASEWRNTVFASHHRLKKPTAYGLDDLHTAIGNAYRYVSMQLGEKIGKLKEDYVSDLQLVDYKPYTNMDGSNMLGHLVFGMFHQYRPESVWCKGFRLMKDYRIDEQRFEPYFNDDNTRQYVEASTLALWKQLTDE